MNESEKRYLYFYVKNYSGTFCTSGYTLPITPFTFIPVLDDVIDDTISNTSIYWDFGDGTISRDITATHSYVIPGIYNVSCSFLTTSGRGFESIFKQSISVKDFYSDTLILSADTDKVNSASHIDTTLLISRINSWQSYTPNKQYTITLYASGEGAPLLNVLDYNKDKFAHLKPSSRFIAYEYNDATSKYELTPVNSVSTDNEMLYVHLSGSTILPCTSSTLGSIFAGTSGKRTFYFTDDTPGKMVAVVAYFNSLDFKDRDSIQFNYPTSLYPILHQANTTTYSLSFDNNQVPAYLSITSNGIDGEETNTTSFNISPEKYVDQPISFVIKVKDPQHYTIKSSRVLSLIGNSAPLIEGTVQVFLIDSSDNIIQTPVISNFGVLSSELYGGYFRGILKSNIAYNNVRIYAQAIVNGLTTIGTSSYFSIFSGGVYSIGKVNENFDASKQLQSYIFQESFQDYYKTFNDFIGTAIGDKNSAPTYLGKKVYERISKFTANIAAVDTCNIEALQSMYSMIGEDFYTFHRFNFNYPAEINRLIEIFSVKFSKLKGGRNTFSKYFENKGYSNVEVKYGANRGIELDILTTILTAGSASKPIVAYEKYSEQYTLLNTDIPSSSNAHFINSTLMTYPMSAFNKWWGWELVLPNTFTINDIQKYYKFYEYVESADDTQLEGVINWSDPLTTINEELSSVESWNNIRDSMLSYALVNAMILSR